MGIRPAQELFEQQQSDLFKLSEYLKNCNILPRNKKVCTQLEKLGFSFDYDAPFTSDERAIMIESAYVHATFPEGWTIVSKVQPNAMYSTFDIFDSKGYLRVTGKCTPTNAIMEVVPPFNLVVNKAMNNSVIAAHIYITGPFGAIVQDFGVKIVPRTTHALDQYIKEAKQVLDTYPKIFEN